MNWDELKKEERRNREKEAEPLFYTSLASFSLFGKEHVSESFHELSGVNQKGIKERLLIPVQSLTNGRNWNNKEIEGEWRGYRAIQKEEGEIKMIGRLDMKL